MKVKRHTVFLIHGGTEETREKYAHELLTDALQPVTYGVVRTEKVDFAGLVDAMTLKPDFIVCCIQENDMSMIANLPPHYYNFKYIDVDGVLRYPHLSTIEDLGLWMTTLLPTHERWVVVGDVHSCIDELKLLLNHYGCKIHESTCTIPEGMGILFVGDLIDKGVKTRETIEFLWANRNNFYFVRGNHDEFVYKYLTGKDKPSDDANYVARHDSIPFFQSTGNIDVREKFFELYGFLREFVECDQFIVTHSPCFYHELGMMDDEALVLQRKMKLDTSKTLTTQMQCIENNPTEGRKYHIFGHIPFKPYHFDGNKIGVDSGCIHGNALGSVLIDCVGVNEPTFYTEKFLDSQPIYPEELVIRSDTGRITTG